MKSLNLIKNYLPRHMRLGLCCDLPVVNAFQNVVESVPVVSDNSSLVCTSNIVKSVPVDESMSKYRASAFRLSALVKSGVPLKMVNINSSNVASIEELKKVCDSIENAESYVNRVNAEKQERQSWFMSFEENSNV